MAEKPDKSSSPNALTLRRAASTLFAIEGRTARRASESHLAAAPYFPEKAGEARQRAFLQAFEQGRGLPILPAIQEIERYHAEWASLVPADDEVCAVLVHLLEDKYFFKARDIPHLRAALGFDRSGVQQAYLRLYGGPLSTIYAAWLTPGEWLRWLWERLAARLEDLPPFWLAYFLTLAALIGPAALALPTALAGVGPLAGVAILLAAGLAGLLTILALGAAAVRNGHLRFGPAPGGLGRLAADYLGRGGALLVNLALFGMIVLLLLACYTGLSTTLAGATGLPPLFFAAVLLALNLYFLGGEPTGPGLAVVLLVGAANLVLLLALSLLALGHPASGLAGALPGSGLSPGAPFDASALTLIAGVVLAAYFGHVAVGGAARLALKGRPSGASGKALLGGLAAAMLTAMLVYCLWVVAVDNALGPATLSSLRISPATVITPLAAQVGRPASLFGCLYVLLALGFASFQLSLALSNQASQWLPARLVATRRSRFWSGIIPIGILFFFFIFWITGPGASFSALFWFSAVALPLAAGVLPMLILAASRHKSDLLAGIPGRVGDWLSRPPVVWFVCLLYLAVMFFYGFLVWKNPFEQIAILAAALLGLGLAFSWRRQGAFTPRLVIHLRLDKLPGERLSFSVNADGQPLAVQAALQYRFQADEPVVTGAEGQVENFTELRRISFNLPEGMTSEIKVWTQQPMPDGSTGALPAWLIIGEKEWDLNQCGGEVITRQEEGAGVVTVLFQ